MPIKTRTSRREAPDLTPLVLLVDGLATYRVTRLITEDHAPLGPVRDWVMDRWPNSPLANWMNCPWCAGLWVAVGVTATRTLAPQWWPRAASTLALSAITGALATWEQR